MSFGLIHHKQARWVTLYGLLPITDTTEAQVNTAQGVQIRCRKMSQQIPYVTQNQGLKCPYSLWTVTTLQKRSNKGGRYNS